MTPVGLALAKGSLREQKVIFAEHLLRYVPLLARLHQALLERGRVPEEEVLKELQRHLPPQEARQVLGVMREWGRFADLFLWDEAARAFRAP
ncbi:AAA-associated domain-containing protein [Thermus oshimai]